MLIRLEIGRGGFATLGRASITKRPNLAYVVVKYRCDASVLVHFRGFREASVQQFVQQPRGDVSRDYLASLRRSRTASTRIKMGRVPRSACSALRTLLRNSLLSYDAATSWNPNCRACFRSLASRHSRFRTSFCTQMVSS